MLMTVTNNTTRILNRPASITFAIPGSTASLNAVSDGLKLDPLPYPFSHNGTIAASPAFKTLPVHPANWRNNVVLWHPMEPASEWNQLVQAGVVTVGYGAEANRRDAEELFVAAV